MDGVFGSSSSKEVGGGTRHSIRMALYSGKGSDVPEIEEHLLMEHVLLRIFTLNDDNLIDMTRIRAMHETSPFWISI
ncbi:hypothetical protein BOX30_04295 [Leptospirillum ferriphilum]|nr:hypothetical protein BOX30_04295 [Leptospirillum ferriphilum]